MPIRNRPARQKAPARSTKHPFRRRRAAAVSALLACATVAVLGGAVALRAPQRAQSGYTRGPSFASIWSALTSTLAAEERTRIDSGATAPDTSRKSTGDPGLATPTVTPKVRHEPEPEPIENDAAVAHALPLKRTIEQVLDEGVDLMRDYRLPASIQIRSSSCGYQGSAMYDSTTHEVELCAEFIEQRYRRSVRDGDAHPLEQARRVARFAVAHELGHALIQVYRLPVLGREEDAADQFAAMLFLTHNRASPVLGAAREFEHGARNARLDRDVLGDDHALDGQRAANLACWLYGFDSETYADVAQSLPAFRLANCAAEYDGMVAAWTRLLAPYRRPE
ncbi:MAG TPA: DUF4344 domain-containing metallopeptidase [Gemmatimonadaceae bacterium]|jgi:hypothetical protein